MADQNTWDRAKEIFGEASELDSSADRDAFIEQQCAGDDSLREQVEALLHARDDAGSFMNAPSAGAPAPVTPHEMTSISSVTERAGQTIGRYKLLQQIGEGGFGVVYMAEQEEPVRRKVALKIIKLGMDTKQVIARFEAERQALAMMDHANIARVLDAGATETGRPYFVMELVKGEAITEYCDKHNLSVEDRLDLFQQTCNAVQHAHQKGIIHRDIKPNNVMITLHDGRPVPKVIDFGIAKATDHKLTEKTIFTEYRQFIGTPEYMSPEQAEMSGIDIDTRSDIYSLGVLLYELLIGTTPFDSESLRSAGYGEVQRIIREDTPHKPSTRLSTLDTLPSIAAHRHTEPRKLGLMIRGDLDWIVMKALEKDRTRRYETASGFAADIQRFLDSEPVIASPPSAAYRLRKFVRRNKAGVMAALLVAGAIVIGVAGTTWGMVRAVRAMNRAQFEAFNASRAAQAEALAKLDAQKAQAEAETTLAELERQNYLLHIAGARAAAAENDAGRVQRHLTLAPAALRSWEWWYLRSQFDHSSAVFTCEGAAVSATFAKDGRSVVAADELRNIWTWSIDSSNHASQTILENWHGRPAVAFSGDGSRFAAVRDSKEVIVGHVSVEADRTAIHAPSAFILALNEDGSILAAMQQNQPNDPVTLSIFNVQTAETIAQLDVPDRPNALALSRDGTVVGAALLNRACVWRIEHQSKPTMLNYEAGSTTAIVFDKTASRVAVAGVQIAVFDTVTGNVINVVHESTRIDPATPLAISADGSLVAFSSDGRVLNVVDVESRAHYDEFRGAEGDIVNLQFSFDGERVSVADRIGKVCVFDLDSRRGPKQVDGGWLVSIGRAGSISTGRAGSSSARRTGRLPSTFGAAGVVIHELTSDQGRALRLPTAVPRTGLHSISHNTAGTLLMTGSTASTEIFNAETGAHIRSLAGATSFALDPEGQRIAIPSARHIEILDVDRGELASSLPDQDARIESVVWSPDGSWVAGLDRTAIVVWDVGQSERMAMLESPGGRSRIVVSPNGTWLAAFDLQGRVMVWRTEDWTLHMTLQLDRPLVTLMLPTPLNGIAFTHDGRRIAAAYRRTIRFWDVESHEEVLAVELPEGFDEAISIEFDDDLRFAVSTSGDRTFVWNVVH